MAKFRLRFEMNGNGWPGSNASGVEQREDLAPEVFGEVRAHGVRVVFGIDEADAVLLERGAQRLAPARRLIFHQPRRATPDGGELLRRGQAIG
jgi:hypothetical protein